MHPALADVLQRSGGLVGRRKFPEWADRFDNAVKAGELVSVLPGVYAHADLPRDWRTLVQAVHWWDADAVIVGEAAAALTFWPELTPTTVDAACRRSRFVRPGFRSSRRTVPADQVIHRAGVTLAGPALTALDLVPLHGGDGIDRALRSRMATLPAMYEALAATPGRRQNVQRQRMLLDSRGEPWSAAERLAHRLLREAGITGWHANVPIICDGEKFFLDIALDDCPVVIEIDGKIHLRPDIFERDRWRGNLLLLAGKQVLHFTWRQLCDEPEWFINVVRRAIAMHR